MKKTDPSNPKIVGREEWLAARKKLMAKEKKFTQARDLLSEERRSLPWVEVTKEYRFQNEDGVHTLAELFGNNRQLIVYHFMFGPEWVEGCPICSFWADNFNGIDVHLEQRDVSLIAVSRVPIDKLIAYKKRMGWNFRWYSSNESDFNVDFGVSFDKKTERGSPNYNFGTQHFPGDEAPGASVFIRDSESRVFHTYSCYSRGLDMLNGAYHYLDITPFGRDEDELPFSMAWVKRRDQYES